LKLSVIIPTYNRREILARTLSTVFAQEFPADDYEVVIVVDGSRDGTLEMLRGLRPACGLQILEQANRGQAAARNAGWKSARGELILFLDDDILCERTLLLEHIAAHQNRPPRVVFGLVRVAPESPDSLAADLVRENSDAYVRRVTQEKAPAWPNDDICFANTSILRSTLLASGGFDEQLAYAKEDHELGLRLWKMGIPFDFQSKAAAFHLYVKSARELVLTEAEKLGRSYVLLSRKHPNYRSQLPLGWTAGESLWKFRTRELLARLPMSVEPLLRIPFWMAERFRSVSFFRRWGLRLLRARLSIVVMRSAVREVGGWDVFEKEFRVRLPVLLYHHVGPVRPGTLRWLTVSPNRFERHVRWLIRCGYTGVRASDWFHWNCDGKQLPRKPVLFTFDDAYADIAEYALPILRRYGFGASVFVVTQQVGNTNAWDEQAGFGVHRLMTAEQIRRWAGQGIEFGAHTRTHAELTRVAEDKLEDEIAGSARDLAEILQSRIISFAYPYGSHDEGVCRAVKRIFDQAFTIQTGLNHLRTNPILLHRTMVTTNDNWIDLLCRVKFGWSPMDRFRRRASAGAASDGQRTV
jgi:glycosyltransferase involved in cell wall biosynthesis/peptidoglycan/xylan/chitin deacetylase (PgdA/CDA1 family)